MWRQDREEQVLISSVTWAAVTVTATGPGQAGRSGLEGCHRLLEGRLAISTGWVCMKQGATSRGLMELGYQDLSGEVHQSWKQSGKELT